MNIAASILTFLVSILFASSDVYAVTPSTPSATPTTEIVKDQKIEDLKDRIATKVAQLQQSERRALYGKVKAKTISTITLETDKKDIKIELSDDIKVFQMLKGKRTTLTLDDVVKDDIVTVFGDYDTTVEILKTKVIFIQSTSSIVRVSGTIKETSKTDYTITIDDNNGKTYIIDFETVTKTSLWAGKDGQVKGGFSKLIPGDLLLVTGTNVPKKENRISALRILNLSDLSGVLPTPMPTAEPTAKTTVKPTIEP